MLVRSCAPADLCSAKTPGKYPAIFLADNRGQPHSFDPPVAFSSNRQEWFVTAFNGLTGLILLHRSVKNIVLGDEDEVEKDADVC